MGLYDGIFYFFPIIVGFILLIYGGDRICIGASALVVRLGVSEFIVGMTIVAISTSTPEFITSLMATVDRHPEVVMGNVVGSNLVNIGLAGGLVALIKPFPITLSIIKKEVLFLWLITLIFGVLSICTSIGFLMGSLLITLYITYLYFICKSNRYEEKKVLPTTALKINLKESILIFLFGFLLIFIGAKLVIHYSVEMARALKYSDTFIGFTIIAIGTSFPEIVVSLVAAFRGYGSICTGNIVGSNIFNTLLIPGSCSAIYALTSDRPLRYFAIPALIFFTTTLWYFFTKKRKIGRWEGFIFLVIFIFIFSLSVHFQLKK